jgi:acetyl-CoA carboxylase biotin carboxylase subunit
VPPPPFTRILIANRGEIAVRLIRACRELGIRSVAIHSEADADARHAREADEAVAIDGPSPVESYLNIPRIVGAAIGGGCQAVHPGYGFLSENPRFAKAVEEAGLAFIGPSAETMRRLGDKTEARALARAIGVPVVPGFEGSSKKKDFAREAGRLGYPVLIKAAAGGGGRGMRRIASAAELEPALESARREAEGAFADDRVFLEKYLESARHVEFQILGDGRGRAIHLFERDCSLQRRHQKLVEESPSPALSAALRERMGEAAVRLAEAAAYRNAGTVEFLLDTGTGEFHFLEVNARLQVEHPVTELLTGVDLVAAQIRIAAGDALPFETADLRPRGHVLECRVYAEDPAAGFLPSAGPILRLVLPEGPGVRVDAGYAAGDEVSGHFDAMLAKVVVCAADREAALRRMDRALAEMVVLGVITNIDFLRALLAEPDFREGRAGTDFIGRRMGGWKGSGGEVPDEVLIAAAVAEIGAGSSRSAGWGSAGDAADLHDPWDRSDGFRMGT